MKTRALTGEDLERALPALAALRTDVFPAFACLYARSPGYERRYLSDFSAAQESFIVAAETEPGDIAGCATGSALSGHHAGFQGPRVQARFPLSSPFCLGESVLRPACVARGSGMPCRMHARHTRGRAATGIFLRRGAGGGIAAGSVPDEARQPQARGAGHGVYLAGEGGRAQPDAPDELPDAGALTPSRRVSRGQGGSGR